MLVFNVEEREEEEQEEILRKEEVVEAGLGCEIYIGLYCEHVRRCGLVL